MAGAARLLGAEGLTSSAKPAHKAAERLLAVGLGFAVAVAIGFVIVIVVSMILWMLFPGDLFPDTPDIIGFSARRS